MSSEDNPQTPPSSGPQKPPTGPPWLLGAAISAIGTLIGTIAFVVFCYSLGLNFSDEGWSDGGSPWATNRGALIGSLVGFSIAILLFWLGFIQMTRTKH